MSTLTRKDFLNGFSLRSKNKSNEYDIEKDVIFKKYSNKSLPLSVKRTRSSLAPYTGVWSERQKVHLIKRTMFGVTNTAMNTIQTLSMSQAVDALVNAPIVSAPPPINYYESFEPDTQGVPFGQTWVNTPYDAIGTVGYWRYLSMLSWWYNNIIHQDFSLQQKMVLFWHNHFATQGVGDNRISYDYIKLLNTHSLGNFKTFVKEITKSSAMLIFLNGMYNNKYSPDENYARELQELFTLGKDTGYTEDDVKAAARVLTGFRLDNEVSTAYFYDDTWHDEDDKLFSSFYGNTTITGLTGAAGETELDALLDMIFTKTDIISKFICRKIYRFFVHYDLDIDTENNIISGLAQTLVANNWEIKPVLSQLFKSSHFYDVMGMDCLIKNPVDYYLGLIRTTNVNLPPITSIEEAHYTNISLLYIINNMAMELGNPPNVAGWSAYYQTPQFHQMWINSDTLPKRLEYTDYLFTDYGIYISSLTQIRSDVIQFAQTCSNPSNPDVLIDHFLTRLVSFTFTQTTKDHYKSILLSGQASNYYWTGAWNDYMNMPSNTIFEGIVRSRLQQVLTQICRLAEHQIS
jgi:hypothetical protein